MDGIVGMIKLSLQPNAPEGWRICDGALLSIADFPELYARTGKQFGGNETHFALPDLRGEPTHYLIKVTPSPEDAQYKGLVSQMVLWVGEDIPAGWFPCDGRPIVGAEYPVLQKIASANMPTVAEVFNLPMAPARPGLRYIICMEGLDPTAGTKGPQKPTDDDDY